MKKIFTLYNNIIDVFLSTRFWNGNPGIEHTLEETIKHSITQLNLTYPPLNQGWEIHLIDFPDAEAEIHQTHGDILKKKITIYLNQPVEKKIWDGVTLDIKVLSFVLQHEILHIEDAYNDSKSYSQMHDINYLSKLLWEISIDLRCPQQVEELTHDRHLPIKSREANRKNIETIKQKAIEINKKGNICFQIIQHDAMLKS